MNNKSHAGFTCTLNQPRGENLTHFERFHVQRASLGSAALRTRLARCTLWLLLSYGVRESIDIIDYVTLTSNYPKSLLSHAHALTHIYSDITYMHTHTHTHTMM